MPYIVQKKVNLIMQNMNNVCLFFKGRCIFEIMLFTSQYVVQESRLEKVKINEILYKNMNAISPISLFLIKGQC